MAEKSWNSQESLHFFIRTTATWPLQVIEQTRRLVKDGGLSHP
jgi:hypothetical protein